jgi:hypothetical protein
MNRLGCPHVCAIALQGCEQLARHRTEIDVGAFIGTCYRDGLVRVAALQHQWNQTGDLVAIFGVMHVGEVRKPGHCGMAALKEIDVIVAGDKSDVRRGMDEAVWCFEVALFDERCPELA